MYTRGVYHTLQLAAILLVVVCAVVILGTADTYAQNIRISFPQDVGEYDPGEVFSVPLIFENPSGFEPDGFDFLVSYSSYLMSFVEILPTPDNPECGWSSFEVTQPADSLIRFVGTAGAGACLTVDSIVLASLVFEVNNDSLSNCRGGIFSFAFIDCSDNTLLELDGDSVFFSDTVYGEPYTTPMPAIGQGTPDFCVEAVVGLRRISYAAGFLTTTCPPLVSRGDLNLNGIAYDISDLVMYTNYFILGPSVFDSVSVDESVSNSDCNADDRTLTVADMLFAYRVLVGDTLPFPSTKSALDTAVFIQDMDAKTVVLDYVEPVAALFLEFGGEITPTPLYDTSNGLRFYYAVVDGYTRVLIAPSLGESGTPTVPPGPVISYSGDAALIRADLSTWDAFWIPWQIEYLNGSCCYGLTGNVDYSPDSQIDAADLAALVQYLFIAPSMAPLCMAEANTDGDLAGVIDISDVVRLISYLYGSPSHPTEDCQ